MNLNKLFKLPEIEIIKDLNSREALEVEQKIINSKPFLKSLYRDFYNIFKSASDIPSGGLKVEIGSARGFIKEIIPDVITSDIESLDHVDLTFDASKMPFGNNSISIFYMQNSLHHIRNPLQFFEEAQRCLMNKGKILIIEPFSSLLSNFIYSSFHHENFDLKIKNPIAGSDYLSCPNQALASIIFIKEKEIFKTRFPDLKIKKIESHTPFVYLLSGGVRYKQLVPSFSYRLFKVIEKLFIPLNNMLGMFVTIELVKDK